MRWGWLVGLVLLGLASPVAAATKYVENTNGACVNTAGGSGTEIAPFCSFQYGVQHISGGDTLYVKNGNYVEGDFIITGPSGTAGTHTVISAYPGHRPILKGTSLTSGRLKISHGCSYIDFIGFEITTLNQGLYLDDDAGTSTACTNVIVERLYIHHVGQEGMAVRAGATGAAARNITIRYNEIAFTGQIGSSQNGEGLYLGNSSGVDTTNGVTVLSNKIHDTQDECIELKGDSHDNIIDGNELYNWTRTSSFGDTGGCIEIDEPRNNPATNANQIIRNNVIHDVTTGGGGTKRGIRLGTGANVYNNILYNIAASYTCILANSPSATQTRRIYHNTVDCTTANAIVTTGVTVDSQNNIGPATGPTGVAFNSAFFVNAAGHNYHLVAGVTPINTGTTIGGSYAVDRDGRARPVAALPDRGAYEYPFYVLAAADCQLATVQAQVNAASTASVLPATVTVPAGNCTWAGSLTLSGKPIRVQGAGATLTHITASAGRAISLSGSATNFVDLSGFEFIKSGNDSNSAVIEIGGTLFSVGFRVHHITLSNGDGGIRGVTIEGVYGVLDHVATVGPFLQTFTIRGSSFSSDQGFTPWQQPLALGTSSAVYIEDSTITYPAAPFVEDALDAYAGARFVFRYNTVTNASIGWHGTDTGGTRSPVSFEVYNNTFTNNSGSGRRGATVRGGSGVFFNNVHNGSSAWQDYQITYYRVSDTSQCGGWQCCNGTDYVMGSSSFSADEAHNSYVSSPPNATRAGWCSTNRDLLGNWGGSCNSGTGTYSLFLDADTASGYACRDQPGVAPNGQSVVGIYAWNNTGSNIAIIAGSAGANITTYFTLNRDYFNRQPQAGDPLFGYAAYTYPHPLTTATPSTPTTPGVVP